MSCKSTTLPGAVIPILRTLFLLSRFFATTTHLSIRDGEGETEKSEDLPTTKY